jgi:excinuclease ABC subunit C
MGERSKPGRKAATPLPAWKLALERKLELLPASPGVYLLKDGAGKIIYVGKAKRLPNRVRSYFRGSGTGDPRNAALRDAVRDLDYVAVESETEALLLEANLVRAHAPRFNIDLKDDKRYPYLKLTVTHAFPKLEVARRVLPDHARYFGPFVHVKDLRKLLRSLRQIFPLRSCTDRRLERGERECLYYHIGLCRAPCTRRIDEAAYGRIVADLTEFLEGGGSRLLHEWEREMHRLAGELRYEDSARLRDDIARLTQLMESQRVVDPQQPDLDAIALVTRGERAAVAVFSHRAGGVVGTWRFTVKHARLAEPGEIMEAILTRHYQERARVPALLLVGDLPRNRELIARWLAQRAGHRVTITVPKRGARAQLLRAPRENARLWLEELELIASGRERRSSESVRALQDALGLPHAPRRIEGYDISNLQGTDAVGSQVTFVDGEPLKRGYRHYRIRTVEGADDFAMLAEVLERRLAHVRETPAEAPDLILVDGGRGQVARAAEVLAAAGYGELPLLGLAKREEEIFLRGASEGLVLPRSSPALQLLQRVRDEAHRFAVGYHRRRRRAFLDETPLQRIPGLGRARIRALLDHFGSLPALSEAPAEEVARVPGIGPALAERIVASLKRGTGDA